MQIKVRDKKTGRLLIFSLGKAALVKHGSLVAMSDGKGGWFVDTDLFMNQYQWEDIDDYPAFDRIPLTETFSFAKNSESGCELAFMIDDDDDDDVV